MALPLLPLSVAGLFGTIATLGARSKGFTSEYEENFDYDFYRKDHPRFYNQNLVSMLNPDGFDQELYNEEMEYFHANDPMY